MAAELDLVVIGAGPGGYSAAARAARLGMKVACVEREERLGGVCLRVGCIPSKALLDSSELYRAAREKAAAHGVRTGPVRLDLPAMMARKDEVVAGLTEGVRRLLERSGVEIVRGTARLAGPGAVAVEAEGGAKAASLRARSVLLAAGSEPAAVPAIPVDGKRIVTSTEALAFDAVPGRLGIVGGGYIGLELGSVWARLGSEVTVIEALPSIASTADGQVSRALERGLRRQGIAFRLATRVVEAKADRRGVRVRLRSGETEEEVSFDRLLVAVGRRPLGRGLGLEEAGVETDPRSGRVQVDAGYRTSVPGVYAVGDLVDGPMLAHKASAEGVALAERLAGEPSEVDYGAIPSVIYTDPEAAAVGAREEDLKARGVEYRAASVPFAGNGRARCLGETEGFVKVLAHAASDRLLGVHIVGPRASELIAEAALAVRLCARSADLGGTVHGHPTLAEALMEAAQAAGRRSLHGA